MLIHLIRRTFRFDGGAEVSVGAYINALATLGHSVGLVCESWQGVVKSIAVTQLPTHGSRLRRAQQFRALARAHMARHADTVFQAHDWVPGAQAIRLGDGLHSSWVSRLARHRSWLGRYALTLSAFHRDRISAEHETLNHPDLKIIVANSQMVADELRQAYPRVSAKIEIVRNTVFVDQNRPRVPRQGLTPILGFAGSGWQRKGLEWVIRCLVSMPRVRLMVAGRDTHAGHYYRLAKKLGVDHQIEWMGLVKEMHDFYSQIDVLVHPALYDPAPNVTTEAMARGIPVVISQYTGTIDFSELDGVVVSNTDASSLCDAVETALGLGCAQREQLQEAMRAFDVDYLKDRLRSIYGRSFQ